MAITADMISDRQPQCHISETLKSKHVLCKCQFWEGLNWIKLSIIFIPLLFMCRGGDKVVTLTVPILPVGYEGNSEWKESVQGQSQTEARVRDGSAVMLLLLKRPGTSLYTMSCRVLSDLKDRKRNFSQAIVILEFSTLPVKTRKPTDTGGWFAHINLNVWKRKVHFWHIPIQSFLALHLICSLYSIHAHS